MTEANILQTMQLIMGTPTNYVGEVTMCILSAFVVWCLGCWFLIVSLLIIKRIFR